MDLKLIVFLATFQKWDWIQYAIVITYIVSSNKMNKTFYPIQQQSKELSCVLWRTKGTIKMKLLNENIAFLNLQYTPWDSACYF